MNILILGSGGREHAFAWKIKQSPLCDQLFIAPGNAGTAGCGTNLPIKTTDFDSLKKAVIENDISLILVGPEDPLVNGVYDFFSNDKETSHVTIIGPSAIAAQLEGSKAFAKAFMKKNNIPTASYEEFSKDNYEDGTTYIKNHSLPIVLKADGLAAGKGVLICQNHQDALEEFERMILQSKFGSASNKVVIESYLNGIEVSVFVLTDGTHYCLLPEAKDYKRIGGGDSGLNTGGMGAVSPVPFFDATLKLKIKERIIEPTINGFINEKYVYNGFVFIGLMIDNGDPYVIEYNCRMGDPETEVVLPRIKNDFVSLLMAVGNNSLDQIKVETDDRTVATTIIVSGGYPGDYKVGELINGLSQNQKENTIVFHSGTQLKNNDVVTNGGRVFAVSAFGKDVAEAASKSLSAVKEIHFNGMNFRSDIGYEFK
jgi:phosphoribosylamine--glycine ligase